MPLRAFDDAKAPFCAGSKPRCYAWGQARIPLSMVNSTIVAGATALLTLGLSAAAGYAFARFRFRGRRALFLLFLMLLIVPAPVNRAVWVAIASSCAVPTLQRRDRGMAARNGWTLNGQVYLMPFGNNYTRPHPPVVIRTHSGLWCKSTVYGLNGLRPTSGVHLN